MKEVKNILILAEMPFDKCSSNSFVHATGRQIFYTDGTSEIEYEDDILDEYGNIIPDIELYNLASDFEYYEE